MTERHTALYRLLAANGRLLYVGISGNPDARWGTHSNNQPWWKDVSDRKVEWFPSREAAAAAEVAAIKSERPLHNKQHAMPETAVQLATPRFRRRTEVADYEAERAVLGGMLKWSHTIPAVADLLGNGSAFSSQTHQMIYRIIVDLRSSGEAPTMASVSDEWERIGRLSGRGGYFDQDALTESALTPAVTVHCAAIVRALAPIRSVLEARV